MGSECLVPLIQLLNQEVEVQNKNKLFLTNFVSRNNYFLFQTFKNGTFNKKFLFTILSVRANFLFIFFYSLWLPESSKKKFYLVDALEFWRFLSPIFKKVELKKSFFNWFLDYVFCAYFIIYYWLEMTIKFVINTNFFFLLLPGH